MDDKTALMSELRELLLLASVVGGLSVLGVAAGVTLAMAIDRWSSLIPVT